ncbi:Dehydrogenase/reductase SDR family member 11 [Camponotus floridanus]|uniref:Dehydrogenase/reductase SDR family member 11 n=1 Tax=Camponotus floridanus TaxID=104421 RepID=E2A8S3_CAMFO|nr:farnesol dehydrogenase [Camponotus floridanus]EFN70152.1 Dehydrogenase/reductase SDR family member 11 [Camponotus floridanus]
MDQWAGKVALVTGASSGIGAETAKLLAKGGMKVIAVARRLENLKELAASIKSEFNVQIYPIKCDVQQEEEILKVFKWAEEELGGVDVLINNAGVVVNKPIIEGATEDFRKIIDVNVIAMAICSRELVQSVKKRNARGYIFNINSIAGHYADLITMPISVYAASKYAVTGMTASLRNEIINAKLDIKITSISPGMVQTEMIEKAFESLGDVQTLLEGVPILKDKDIADLVIYGLSTPRNAQICEVIITPHEAIAPKNPRPFSNQ